MSIIPVSSYAISQIQNESKQYVVIYEDGEKHNVETYTITATEANKIRQQNNVLVVEEGSYVYGSKNHRRNSNGHYHKKVHKRNIEKRYSKSSDVEWNIQAIKADNIEIAIEPISSTINIATGPAITVDTTIESDINLETATGPAITTDPTTAPDIPTGKVKVALIDSGIDYTPDIDVYKRINFIPGQDDVSIIYEDSCGHGTSVAGIIAAKDNNEGITGINPNVELYSARVLDSNLSAPVSRVV